MISGYIGAHRATPLRPDKCRRSHCCDVETLLLFVNSNNCRSLLRYGVEKATAAYDSPAYAEALKALGDGAVRDLRIVEGVE